MSEYHIAVLDIGKTNKKLLIFDAALRCLNPDAEAAVFDPVEIDGLLCDDMASIARWMMDSLRAAARTYAPLRCISISAHGATLALLGAERDRCFPGDGGLVFPIVSYEQEISPADEQAFFDDMGMTPEEMQRETGTARFAWLLNHGKQIHWLQRTRPERFARVTDVLMFPQYLAYLLTGEKAIEPTYIGCHGYLLHADGTRYSRVAEKLGLLDKLPPLPFRRPYEALGPVRPDRARSLGLPDDCIVTLGVHDSNAALVPYFAKGFERFVVQDSGTWIVTMSPRREAVFEPDELGREVFFNRSMDNQPVKTTIFRGGAEFDFYARNVLPHAPHPETMDPALLREIVLAREAFSLPAVQRGTGLFAESVPRFEGVDVMFRDTATAWCVMDAGLAVQGWRAIALAAGEEVERVFIEGNVGRRNPVYRAVISGLLPRAEVRFGTLGGAPYGAAVLGAAALEGKHPRDLADRIEMRLEEVPKPDLPPEALRAYAEAFLARLR